MAFVDDRSRLRIIGFSVLLAATVLTGAVAAGGDLAALATDAARTIAGDRAVATLEDLAYGARDRPERMRHEGEPPTAHWAVPWPALEVTERGRPATRADLPWSPRDVGPMYDDFAAEGDGRWVSVTTGDGEAVMKKTLLHPDRTRSLAELFVVAIDLSGAALHYVPGTAEPENVAPGADALERSAEVPAQDRDALLAAFNGGFKTRHGQHGVEVSGLTLVPMRSGLCTLVGRADGSVALAAFEKVPSREDAAFVRQSARCLVEDGVRHPGLVQELTASWGAAVGGDTVIRRSAIGISADGRTLFVGVSNRTTAPALADGMRHAGARTGAQLDVNEAFPRFLTYEKSADGKLVAESIAPGFHYRAGHYVDAPSSRDFFYLTRKSAVLAVRAAAVHASGG